MATKFNTTEFRASPFMTSLLAPLPVDAVQVDAAPFIRQLKKDAKDLWFRGMRHVYSSNHNHNHHCTEHAIAKAEGGNTCLTKRCWDRAEDEYFNEVSRQMMIPAPDKAALNWKIGIRMFRNGHPEWEAAIARDEVRLR